MTTILIVDDHPLVGDGIKTMLAGEESMQVTGVCRTAEETLQFMKTETPDVILLDINLPDEDGLTLCEKIRARNQHVKIIGLTSSNETGIITGLIQRGGNGYLLKNVDRNELIEAIRAVSRGKVYLSSDANDKIVEQLRATGLSVEAQPVITRREKQILELLADGHKGPQIAEQLHLSPLTVETHRKNLFRKFNVGSVQMMLKIARDKKLI
jgi:two-component system nitrate/nitrite response regulator NarL